jgi:SAM-dependent methyltransferase
LSWGYGILATEVYDLDKPIGSSFGDVEYYRSLLEDVDGRVLEPAVGTGRIMIPLLEAGVTVDGFDNSPQMLEVCRRRSSERGWDPVIFDGDMTSYVADEPYAAVIIPTGSIALLGGRELVCGALECFRNCLVPGGRLVMDLGAPQLLGDSEPMRSWTSEPFIWTLQTMHIEYDPVANQTVRWLRYDKWRDGALVASELQTFRLQHWSISEFTQLLEGAGFADVSVTADYLPDGAPEPDAGMWTFHARRF